MKIFKFLPVLLLAVLLAGGCSKESPKDASPKPVDLGTVELVYSTPSRHELGDGKTCVLRAEPLGAGTMEVVAIIEKAGKELASTRALPVNVGRPLELSTGGFQIKLIPQIKQ